MSPMESPPTPLEELKDLSIHKNESSPISRLSPDVLSSIFLLCLPNYLSMGNAPFSPHMAPLSITYVCQHWRELAFATHLLWTTIFLHHIQIPNKSSLLPLVNLWLQRSSDTLLDIFIFYPHDKTKTEIIERMNRLVPTIVDASRRWRNLTLFVRGGDQAKALWALQPGYLNNLEYINVPVKDGDVAILPAFRHLWKVASTSPRLRDVKLIGPGFALPANAPWDRLEKLTLRLCSPTERMTDVLRQTFQIRELDLATREHPPWVGPSLELPHLERLSVSATCCCCTVLDSLTATSLKTLKVEAGDSSDTAAINPPTSMCEFRLATVISFLQRSKVILEHFYLSRDINGLDFGEEPPARRAKRALVFSNSLSIFLPEKDALFILSSPVFAKLKTLYCPALLAGSSFLRELSSQSPNSPLPFLKYLAFTVSKDVPESQVKDCLMARAPNLSHVTLFVKKGRKEAMEKHNVEIPGLFNDKAQVVEDVNYDDGTEEGNPLTS